MKLDFQKILFNQKKTNLKILDERKNFIWMK